jgi:hypothetical protein
MGVIDREISNLFCRPNGSLHLLIHGAYVLILNQEKDKMNRILNKNRPNGKGLRGLEAKAGKDGCIGLIFFES